MVLIGIAVIGRRGKRLFGLRGSTPAFVFANLFFNWFVYLLVIHQAVSKLLDIIFHAELIMLHIGLHRILSGDPGFVNCEPLSNTETYLEGSELPISDIIEGCPSVFFNMVLFVTVGRYFWHGTYECLSISEQMSGKSTWQDVARWKLHRKKYPEFQLIVHPQPGETFITTRFINPCDKGIWQNLMDFIDAKG